MLYGEFARTRDISRFATGSCRLARNCSAGPSFLINLRIDSSRLAIVPRLRTSPSVSATATAIVSAWTSKPKNRNFSLMTGSLRLWLWTKFVKQTQPNPRLAHRAGHTIMTTLQLTLAVDQENRPTAMARSLDRKSTRLNSSHLG